MSSKISTRIVVIFLSSCLLGSLSYAQRNFDTVQVRSAKLSDGIFMLTGSGGNIGLSSGEDGIFIIDDQFAPLTDKIKTAIATATGSTAPVRFVLNTHWHWDHTGGNENMGKAGAVIVAHKNVRKRMSVENFNAFFKNTTPASPAVALPVVTFTTDVTFHLNGDEIHVFHVDTAHTDGDAIVHFLKSNIVHMGDCFFNGFYPFIDVSSGGSVTGMIEAVDRVLAMINDQTKLIPGHGPLAGKAELKVFRDMLAGIAENVAKLIVEGKTLDEVKAAKPSKAFDETWGKGFMSPDNFVGIVYTSLAGIKK